MTYKRNFPWIIRLLIWVWRFFVPFFTVIGLISFICVILISMFIYRNLSVRIIKDSIPQVLYKKSIQKPTILRMNLDRKFYFFTPERHAFQKIFEEPHFEYFRLKKIFKKAKENNYIKALFLDIQQFNAPYAEIEHLVELLKDFKKPIYVSATYLDYRTYYLSSVAEKINLAPMGNVELFGPSMNIPYFSEALNKIGINFEVIRAGMYKSSFEPFVQNAPSKESRKMYRELTGSLHQYFISRIAENRSLPRKKIQEWFQRSLFSAKDALKMKIIQDISHPDGFLKKVQKVVQANEVISLDSFASTFPDLLVNHQISEKPGVAVILATGGEISMAESITKQGISYEGLHKQITWAKESPLVKGVILVIDTPGGSALASDLIWLDLRELAKTKPIVAYLTNTAASGGYYIASAANYIVASHTSITGSIGVIAALPNIVSASKKYGFTFHSFSRTKRQAMLNPSQKLTKEDRKLLQEQINQAYKLFLTRVSEGRKLPVKDIQLVAEGRVLTGMQALQYRLVDKLGTLRHAMSFLRKSLKISGKEEMTFYHYTGNQRILDVFKKYRHFFSQKKFLQVIDGKYKSLEFFLKATLIHSERSGKKNPFSLLSLAPSIEIQ